MKLINKHSDSNFVKGFGLFLLFGQVADAHSLEELLNDQYLPTYGKDRFFKISKVFALAVLNEHYLIEKMYFEYNKFAEAQKNTIQNLILKQIARYHSFKGKTRIAEAQKVLRNQVSDSKNLVTPPILQYAAGYTMGSLISFAKESFSIDQKIIDKFEEFKDKRNLIIHNSTSSREDIDQNLDAAISLGLELKKLLNDERSEYIK